MSPYRSRRLHDPASLRPLFAPDSIAVVGISTRVGSFGQRAWINCSQFTGRLYAVNPRYQTYEGRPCYPDIKALPEVPDCVLLATSREMTQELLEDCAAAGVRSVVVFASGYAETGLPERRQEQERMAALARESGMRILGPNCMGYINNALRIGLTFAGNIQFSPLDQHAIGLASQSGAIGGALLEAAAGRGKQFSHMLTSGNAIDVDVADQIAYLAEEGECKAIACVLEGISSPERLIEAGLRARRAGKPVVVFKVARSAGGARAAVSHTGALAGMDAAYAAAFARAGMVLVDDIEHLLDTATFLAKAVALPGGAPGVAVLSASGGMAIAAADKASVSGVPLPQPSPATSEVLAARIPEFGSARNPCDVTAQVTNDMGSLVACADALLGDPAYGALVYAHSSAHDVATERLRRIDAAGAGHRRLVCVVWMSEWLEGPGAREAEVLGHTAVFRSMRACFEALRALRWWQSLPADVPRQVHSIQEAARRQAIALLGKARGDVLTEGEGMRVLAAYGLPVVSDELVRDEAQAATAATRAGFPVVMKIVSPDVPHKTEVGGVQLDVRDADSARAAYRAIVERTRAALPNARIDGVVVQPMLAGGVEMVLGSRVDPVFGPIVLVGLGGVWVELHQDVAVRMAPVSIDEAKTMLLSLRGAKLLQGFRGSVPVDLDRLSQVVADFSAMVADLAQEVQEIDINPLICNGDRIVAVDALVRPRASAHIDTPLQLQQET